MKSIKHKFSLLALLGALIIGCAENSGFDQIGAGLLSATGIPGTEHAGSLFSAGSKLSKAASGLTAEQEYYLGRSVAASILMKYPRYANNTVESYVNRVGATVAAFSDRPETYKGYHFMVLDTAEINAVSAPGGFVFVSKGFLQILPDEDALAAVLAHEVGHIVLGHGTKAISQANLTEALTILGKEAATSYGGGVTSQLTTVFGDSVTDVVNTVLEKGYSRSQEYDADEQAAELLKRAGYNQGSLLTVLSALETKAKENSSGGWFSTHPDPDDRLDEAKDYVSGSSELPTQKVRTARFSAAMKGLKG